MNARTITGNGFSRSHSRLLSALAQSRRYESPVWLSGPVIKMLSLTPKPFTENPVELLATNGSCIYYHISQFTLDTEEITKRWDAHASRSLSQASMKDGRPVGSVVPPLPTSSPYVALNTNGEPLPPESQSFIHENFSVGALQSPYWATPDEASYIFQSPFRPSYLRQAQPRAVPVANYFDGGEPLHYFSTEGTTRADVFTPDRCCRYDPYNYEGRFYAPLTAVRMKRFAIEHDCLAQRRWMTPQRIRRHGAFVLPHVEPLIFIIDEKVIQLINIQLTSKPAYLEAEALEASEDDSIESLLLMDSAGSEMDMGVAIMPTINDSVDAAINLLLP